MMARNEHQNKDIRKNYLKTGRSSSDSKKSERTRQLNIDMMVETFLGNETEQRRVRYKNTQDEKVAEKIIALERKNLDFQIRELSAEQRLIKSRYLNMVKRTRANEASMKEGKK